MRGVPSSVSKIYSYAESTELMARVRPAFDHFPCCFVGWDNTARRGRHAIVMVGSTPELFRGQLELMVKSVMHKDREDRVILSTPGTNGPRG